MSTITQPQKLFHYGIAEKGKLFQLAANYKEALRYYREAIRLVQGIEHGEIFFQHYSQCVMEALELSGSYDEVISYCEKFIEFLEEKETDDLVKKYKGSILEKLSIQYLLKEDKESALDYLKEAQSIVGKGKQPLTDELLNWTQRGFQISKKQLQDAQKKYHYFVVDKTTVNPAHAIELPPNFSPF